MRQNYEGNMFLSLLLVLFIGLKLGGVIDWSWWWVMSPLWIPLVTIVPLVFLVVYYKSKKGGYKR